MKRYAARMAFSFKTFLKAIERLVAGLRQGDGPIGPTVSI